MDAPTLRSFNLENLVKSLNSAILRPEEIIGLGEYADKTPGRNTVFYRWSHKEIGVRGEYPLEQTVHGRGTFALLGVPSEINIGSVFVETGYTEVGSSDYDGGYEKIRLRIKEPIELKNGEVIPTCKIEILQEFGEWVESLMEREDHIKRAGLWVKADLSNVLPSEWFLGGRTVERYDLHTSPENDNHPT